MIFETPIQRDYEARVEVRSLLPTQRLEEIDGRLAVTDEDSHRVRYVKFWIDDAPGSPTEGRPFSVGEDGSRAPTSPERRARQRVWQRKP